MSAEEPITAIYPLTAGQPLVPDETALDIRAPRPYVPMPEPARHEDAPATTSGDDRPCPCESGKPSRECDGRRPPASPDRRALLSCGPGVATRISLERVREGAYEDIAVAGRMASVRLHKPAVDSMDHIRRDLEHGVHDIGAILGQNPALHADRDLNADLRWLAAELASQLAELGEMGFREWVKAGPVSLARAEAGTAGAE